MRTRGTPRSRRLFYASVSSRHQAERMVLAHALVLLDDHVVEAVARARSGVVGSLAVKDLVLFVAAFAVTRCPAGVMPPRASSSVRADRLGRHGCLPT
jgi:hypothetical protein